MYLGTDHNLQGGYDFLFRSEKKFRTIREFFFLHQNQNIFFSNIGNQYFFRKKPLPCQQPFLFDKMSSAAKTPAAKKAVKSQKKTLIGSTKTKEEVKMSSFIYQINQPF